jgi:uncharacterized protein (TIGR00730 family)
MMNKIKSVAVYCGSAQCLNPHYHEAIALFGQILAKERIKVIYGGGGFGLMGTLANECLNHGGHVVGISTDYLYPLEGLREGQPQLSELLIVKHMHERKNLMFERSDAFVILPGGLGTLEEAFEVLTWRQLGLHIKPIIFLNTLNYWKPLLDHLFSHMITQGFVHNDERQLFQICDHPTDILKIL